MKYAVCLFVVLMLSGCLTPRQRFNRLIKKYPDLLEAPLDSTITADTAARDTAIIIPADSATLTAPDSATRGEVVKGRVRIKYVRLPGKTITIDCHCDTARATFTQRTVTVTKAYKVPVKVEVPARLSFWHKVALFFIICGAAGLGWFLRSVTR
jgi:hypothetical protein